MSEDHFRRVKDYKGMCGRLITNQRRITIGKDLSGGVALLIEGQEDIIIPPDNVLQLAKAMLEMIGVRVELNPQSKLIHPAA